jgi:hypothetical protein
MKILTVLIMNLLYVYIFSRLIIDGAIVLNGFVLASDFPRFVSVCVYMFLFPYLLEPISKLALRLLSEHINMQIILLLLLVVVVVVVVVVVIVVTVIAEVFESEKFILNIMISKVKLSKCLTN